MPETYVLYSNQKDSVFAGIWPADPQWTLCTTLPGLLEFNAELGIEGVD